MTVLNTNDPLYAYNTPGYTNQNDGTTGSLVANVEGAVNTGTQLAGNSFLGEPEALSGYIARSIDPSLNSVGAQTVNTAATTTAFFAAIQVLEPALSSKVVIYAKYSTTSATAGIALYNYAGTKIASCTSGALASSFGVVTTSWSTAPLLYPGTYYVGLVTASGSGFVEVQGTTLTTENTPLAQATTFAANVLNWRFFSATVTANTLPTTLSGTVAGMTNGFFVGIF